MHEGRILSSCGCVGVGRLWDINRSWFQRPLLTRLYVRASIQLSLSHCSLVTGWSAGPCDLSFWEILRQAVHMWWHLKAGFLGGKAIYKMRSHVKDQSRGVSVLKAIYSDLKIDVFSEEGKVKYCACWSGWNHWMRGKNHLIYIKQF